MEKGPVSSQRAAGRVRRLDRVTAGLLLTLGLLIGNLFFATRALTALSHRMADLKQRDVVLFDEAWKVRYLDEALTHSASQYVLTSGDPQWKQRYDGLVKQLDTVLADLRANGDKKILRNLDDVEAANKALVALERQVFSSVDATDTDTAGRLLSGPYVKHKEAYKMGLNKFFDAQRLSIDSATNNAQRQADIVRLSNLVAGLVLSAAVIGLGSVHRRQVRVIADRDTERDSEISRQAFERRLHRTLDMAQTEPEALTAVTDVLAAELPNETSELLLADSSNAHLMQVSNTHPDKQWGCGVSSPNHCPAIRSATTMVFANPTSYDSCPHLRRRDLGGCQAVCVPVSITGSTVGVVHSILPAPVPAPAPGHDHAEVVADAVRITERVSTRAGERLGVIRAFAMSQLQASTDPLTGLLNRRSLEIRSLDLLRTAGTVTVIYLDLDHFKVVNDTHGHATGDKALRQFAKVIRDSARSTDIIGRWGGEEFVIVLPDNSLEMAQTLCARIQHLLEVAGNSGSGPAMTTSAGIAASNNHETFSETVARADAALLEAKEAGRNRVVCAAVGEPTDLSATWPVPQEKYLQEK
jgi:diguanylate cyclase (GGDEF)-like protein